MLRLLRDNVQSWIIKVLFVLLVLSFAVWGVGDYLNRDTASPVVVIDDVAISPGAFSEAYDRDLERLRQTSGGAIDKKMAEQFGFKRQTLNNLIHQQLLIQEARRMRLTVSPDRLRREIRRDATFSNDNGRFDSDRYRLILRNNRLTPQRFERDFWMDLVTGPLKRTLGSSFVVPELLIQSRYQSENEQREVALLLLDPEKLLPEISVEAKELEAYLRDNGHRFMTPLRVKVRYAVLSSKSVRNDVIISEEEIAEDYEARVASFQREEERHVRHILIRVDDVDADDAALQKIQQAEAELRSGRSFEEVARKFSEDTTAQEGGDLGTFGRGIMLGPFEDAAFALNAGEVSTPVKTDFGYHLIRVDEIYPASIKTLEEVADSIRERLVEQKSVDLVYDRSITLEDQLFTSGDLQAIAKDLSLTYQETGWMERDSENLSGVTRETAFMEAAFSTPKGEFAPLLELPDGRFVALEIVLREEPRRQKLNEVRDMLELAFKKDRAMQSARDQMRALLKELQEKAITWEQASAEKNIETVQPEPFRIGADATTVMPEVRRAAFRLGIDHPIFPEVLQTSREIVIMKILKIIPPDPEGLKQSRDAIYQQLEEALSRDLMLSYLAGLRAKTDVRIDEAVLNRF